MSTWFLVAVLIAFGLVACIATGRWRYVFRLFAIRPERMTVEKLQLAVKDATDAERVNSILAGFAGGFNAMIREPSTTACHDYCDSLPVFNRPFAEEGVAMGYTLRHLFRFDPKDFEDQLVKQRPEYRD
ncbi:MAG: DUF1702 family protein, partial [Planctomycetes bacterium]|nr:DUF1702 family protein [Planctomycetota bacterium]